MNYLIVGIGNKGKCYENTRHNVGFMILDEFALFLGIKFKEKDNAEIAKTTWNSHSLVLAKPSSYVNLSGPVVHFWQTHTHTPMDNLLVVVDDLVLPFSKIRFKRHGSHGGHNGLKSIIQSVGSSFSRLRFGIGNNFEKGTQSEHVLGQWSSTEQAMIKTPIFRAIEGIQCFIDQGIETTMNNFNS